MTHPTFDPSADSIIDTFPAFLNLWDRAQSRSLDAQIDAWASGYMAFWPDLQAMQIEDYATQNLDWRQVARERVFPDLRARLPAMILAHQNLLKVCGPVYTKARRALGFDSRVIFVIYVGIGCGAGWATTFRDCPAVLFGLENIAECGWSDKETLWGLAAHEIGHLVHASWRQQHQQVNDSGPWWQLYEEGFGQYCENRILETGSWHQVGGQADWLGWCRAHRSWLAAEFLKTVDAGKPIHPFFGSWFDLYGRSETGYYLGYEVIKELEKRLDLRDIAILENVENYIRPVLEQLAKVADG